MLSWVTSWWRSTPNPTPGPILGPARNAPNDGLNIKSFLEQQSNLINSNANIPSSINTNNNEQPKIVKKSSIQNIPVQFVSVSVNDIQTIRSKLNKVPQKEHISGSQDPPLLREMHKIFSQGNEGYFASLKMKREQKRRDLEVKKVQQAKDIKMAKMQKDRVTNLSRGEKMRQAHYAGIKRAEEEAQQRAEKEDMRRVQLNVAKEVCRQIFMDSNQEDTQWMNKSAKYNVKMLATDPTKKNDTSLEEEWANRFNIPVSSSNYADGWDKDELVFDGANFSWNQSEWEDKFESDNITVMEARQEWNNRFLSNPIQQITMEEPTPMIVPTSLGLDVSFTMALHRKIKDEIDEFVNI